MTTSAKSLLAGEVEKLLAGLAVPAQLYKGGTLAVRSPISGEIVAHVREHRTAEATPWVLTRSFLLLGTACTSPVQPDRA